MGKGRACAAAQGGGVTLRIFGIGTDILDMQWIRNIYMNQDDPFIIKSFSEKERNEASLHRDPVVYLSTRFAGKEAIIKSLDINESIRLDEIEILGTEAGRPMITLTGAVKAIADKKEIKNVMISLSHDGDYSIAFAIAEY